ncbi:cytochrome c oxidase subunit 4 [Subtercola endophyticus]|uniref:cytochrome c oxidase subunit 4 n=1 Tax=Subtercola endophyticus TaxID=2895559 RepID=UPI001E2F2950|nr:cytochrome c oxidase subunit 4 [Subtercola endophyticus]UFS60455.1 cytochrome c oxidase subunit 4 [Subtercola endophyticus]
MRANRNVFWILAGFFLLADAVYIFWSLVSYGEVEWVGTIGIALAAILGGFIAFYLGRVHSAQGGELPEDVLTSNIDDGDPEMGFYSPWSWWPIILGGALAIFVTGLAIGTWISFIAVGLILIAIVGWVYEYYRGFFAR